MTGNEFQKAALRTANTDDTLQPYGNLTNGVMGLCGESGECIDIVKKFLHQGHELDREKLAEELGDVAWYLALTAFAIGYDLDTIFEMNKAKLEKRYPNGFSAAKSIHREEYEHDQTAKYQG